MIEYFRWLFNDATYGQWQLEEFKWSIGILLVLGLLFALAKTGEYFESVYRRRGKK